MADSFSYFEDSHDPNIGIIEKHLTNAVADYFVIGWHSDVGDEPLVADGHDTSLLNRLKALNLKINSTKEDHDFDSVTELLNSTETTRLLLHGSIFNVTFDFASKPSSAADEIAAKIGSDTSMEPLSVGTTPLDSMLAFLGAHDSKKNIETFFGSATSQATTDILSLAEFLYAADDSYDERVRAQDLLYTNNYEKHPGGTTWNFNVTPKSTQEANVITKKSTATMLTSEQLQMLQTTNEAQARADKLAIKLSAKRWELFALWWKYVCDPTNALGSTPDDFQLKVNDLSTSIKSLYDLQTAQKKIVHDNDNEPIEESPQPSYFVTKEPTLCIAGVDQGWPADFMNPIVVRNTGKLLSDTSQVSAIWQSITAAVPNPLPKDNDMNVTAEILLGECIAHAKSTKRVFSKGFQDWGAKNSFQPLFVEWEALYYHIDRSKWQVGFRDSSVDHKQPQVRFQVAEPLYQPNSKSPPMPGPHDNQHDFRYITGRVMITPQPIFSLQTLVSSVMDAQGSKLEFSRSEVSDNIQKLQFLSCPLTGLREHLLTQYIGTHTKPLVRIQEKKDLYARKGLHAIKAAVDATNPDPTIPNSKPIFSSEILEMILGES